MSTGTSCHPQRNATGLGHGIQEDIMLKQRSKKPSFLEESTVEKAKRLLSGRKLERAQKLGTSTAGEQAAALEHKMLNFKIRSCCWN
ncbi:unnamed protein product [Nesidiocoris tenuis]|uniref:Uncharacterized protein n=1 Tax=Nesidiocoris tenuis TaxID=355587 RepID=A0A6H5H891_9HEMI|nr:unnamed protein product [Nesidiocoris tenuis]